MIVKLKHIVDKFEEINDEWSGYLNLDTGEIPMIGNGYMAIAEDAEEDDDFSEYQDWEQELIAEAALILEKWERIEKLPDRFDIDEYRIMEDFSCLYPNEAVSKKLCDAIQGKGAFRRFKEMINRLGIEEKWYTFREKALIDFAREWCGFKEIPYED